MPDQAVEALAEAWASIDGKLRQFRYGKRYPTSERARREGYYDGYLFDADELVKRTAKRGFILVSASDGRRLDA